MENSRFYVHRSSFIVHRFLRPCRAGPRVALEGGVHPLSRGAVMATASLNLLVRRLRQSTETAFTDRQADEELLSRFVAGDTSAFEVLVWRYGPAVLAACRKVLTTEADVEDAFQATFLT